MMILRHVLFCLSDILLQKYDSEDVGLILKTNTFSLSWHLNTDMR
jgi:hypothetical protein